MVALLVLVTSMALAAYRFEPDQSIEYLLSLTQTVGGAPAGIPADFDCAWRVAAGPYALRIAPSLTKEQQLQLHEALQLTTLCGKDFVALEPQPRPSVATMALQTAMPEAGAAGGAHAHARREIFVDAGAGSDSKGSGAIASPLKTIEAAVAASRKSVSASSHSASTSTASPIIQLRKGVYYLAKTIVLEQADSGL